MAIGWYEKILNTAYAFAYAENTKNGSNLYKSRFRTGLLHV